jgi:hypothetical protein
MNGRGVSGVKEATTYEGQTEPMETPKPADLREKAERYRAMANSVSDQRLIEALLSLASEYEALAKRVEKDRLGGDK